MSSKPSVGENSHWFWGDAQEFQRGPLRFLRELASDYAPVTRLRLAGKTNYAVSSPQLFQQVLRHDGLGYYRDRRFSSTLREATGGYDRLATSQGEDWHKLRKLLQPAFRPQCFGSLAECVEQEVERRLDCWENRTFDFEKELFGLVQAVLGRTLVGHDLAREYPEFLVAAGVRDYQQVVRTYRWMNVPRWVPSRSNKRFRWAVQLMDTVSRRILQERRKMDSPPADLLQFLLENSDMNDQRISTIVFGMLSSGVGTTTSGLTWLFYHLAEHADCQELCAQEALLASQETPYLDRVFKESLRLYPPIWMSKRETIKQERLGDFTLEPGSTIMLNLYGLHRHPEYWSEPDSFVPDRFLEPVSKWTYLPFFRGPRNCIGEWLGRALIRYTTSAVLRRLRLLPTTQRTVPRPVVTIATLRGLWLSAVPRV